MSESTSYACGFSEAKAKLYKTALTMQNERGIKAGTVVALTYETSVFGSHFFTITRDGHTEHNIPDNALTNFCL